MNDTTDVQTDESTTDETTTNMTASKPTSEVIAQKHDEPVEQARHRLWAAAGCTSWSGQ